MENPLIRYGRIEIFLILAYSMFRNVSSYEECSQFTIVTIAYDTIRNKSLLSYCEPGFSSILWWNPFMHPIQCLAYEIIRISLSAYQISSLVLKEIANHRISTIQCFSLVNINYCM